MKLPDAERAVIPPSKLTEYLLVGDHRSNGGKAAFFARLGYTLDNWPELSDALLGLAREGEVDEIEATTYGKNFAVEGGLVALRGRPAWARSIWFVGEGAPAPRLVTAYPGKERIR